MADWFVCSWSPLVCAFRRLFGSGFVKAIIKAVDDISLLSRTAVECES